MALHASNCAVDASEIPFSESPDSSEVISFGNARLERERRVLDLFIRYHERVVVFARRAGAGDTAEDVAQEVFARLLRKHDVATAEITPGYLIKIAENLIRRNAQRQRSLARFAFRSRPREIDETAPEASECRETQRPPSADDLSRLCPRERDAVDMIVCRGLSYEAAAAALDVRVSTVNNWKFRGLQRLKSIGAA
jgi:RNA polymerase sigma factor (sigma-70 family)